MQAHYFINLLQYISQFIITIDLITDIINRKEDRLAGQSTLFIKNIIKALKHAT